MKPYWREVFLQAWTLWGCASSGGNLEHLGATTNGGKDCQPAYCPPSGAVTQSMPGVHQAKKASLSRTPCQFQAWSFMVPAFIIIITTWGNFNFMYTQLFSVCVHICRYFKGVLRLASKIETLAFIYMCCMCNKQKWVGLWSHYCRHYLDIFLFKSPENAFPTCTFSICTENLKKSTFNNESFHKIKIRTKFQRQFVDEHLIKTTADFHYISQIVVV